MTKPLDWHELSQMSPLLATLPAKGRRITRRITLVQSERLFDRGDRPHAMYFILAGEVRLLRSSRTGGEIVLQRSHCGFIAEASLDQSAYHCDAVAAMPSELLAIPMKEFKAALSSDVFRADWISHLSRELRNVRAQAERLSLRTARERIIHFIETAGSDGETMLAHSRKDWAGELGLTHEALYRTLARMRRNGEIAVSGRMLRLKRLATLDRLNH